MVDDPGLLQQIIRDLSAHHCPTTGELHLEVLPKATGVIIDHSAGISKCLYQTVDQQNLLLEGPIVGLKRKQKALHYYMATSQ